jgi:endoglucanase
MFDLMNHVKSLSSLPGISGYESPVREFISQEWISLVDELKTSRVGSLHGLKHGTGKSPRPTMLITAHMDAIGLMVSDIKDGFLYVTNVGGIDARVLPGLPVLVHGRRQLPGVLALNPIHRFAENHGESSITLKSLVVDIGLAPAQVKNLVSVGDPVSFDTQPVEMEGAYISGHSLDNRISIGALTLCLRELAGIGHYWDVWAVASVQEEINLGGAATSTYEIDPDIAIILDTTYGKSPLTDGWEFFELGAGPTLGLGANIHPYLHRRFQEAADRSNIPCKVEPMPTDSLTDAWAVQVSRSGVPCMVISIPIRNMHTAVELAKLDDLRLTARLLTEFIRTLEPDFLSRLTWED